MRPAKSVKRTAKTRRTKTPTQRQAIDIKRTAAIEMLKQAAILLKEQKPLPPEMAAYLAAAFEGASRRTEPKNQNDALLSLLLLKKKPNRKDAKDPRTAARAFAAAMAVECKFDELIATYGTHIPRRAKYGRRHEDLKILACKDVGKDFNRPWQTIYRWHKDNKAKIGAMSKADRRQYEDRCRQLADELKKRFEQRNCGK